MTDTKKTVEKRPENLDICVECIEELGSNYSISQWHGARDRTAKNLGITQNSAQNKLVDTITYIGCKKSIDKLKEQLKQANETLKNLETSINE